MTKGLYIPRRQLEVVRLGKGSAGGVGVQRFRVKEFGDHPDSIVCHTWDGQTEGDSDVHVAKPWDCRRTPFEGQSWDGVSYEYTSNVQRTAVKNNVTETQVLVRPYLPDSEILAVRDIRGGTGVNIPDGKGGSTPVVWEELPGRNFAAQAEGSQGSAVASGGVLVTGGVQNNVAATRDPTPSDDEISGYGMTSVWVNIVSDAVFMCADPTAGLAVWRELSAGLSAAVRRRSHLMRIDDPTASDDYEPCYVPAAATMTRVVAVTDTGTVDFNIERRSKLTPGSAGTNVWSADKQASSGGLDQTTFDDGAIAADTWLHVDISAVSGSPTRLRLAISYEMTGA